MRLSDSTISRIKNELSDQGIKNRYLQSELCDHIASDIEQMMDQGFGEDEAWTRAFAQTAGEELKSTAKQYGGILNSRYLRIKIFLWITFILFTTSWLFSPSHGPYTALLSFCTLGLTLMLLSIDFFRSRKNHTANIWSAGGSLLSALLVICGFTLFFLVIKFRINARGHSVDLMIFSYVILSTVIFFYFLRQRKLALSGEGRHINTWFAAFSGIQLLFALLSFLSLPFYAWVADYIWILIWVILAVNLFSLILLLVRRIRNILFMILLLLSFMITFIHSPLRRLLPTARQPVTQIIEP